VSGFPAAMRGAGSRTVWGPPKGGHYVLIMARGFESKDVEFQQAEAERVKKLGRALTALEREAQSKRQTIELALTRARADLAAARTPAHQRMLTDAIAALEQQLAAQPSP
jgi:hypothetical protein